MNIEEFEEDYKSTNGYFTVKLTCDCPYCSAYQDVWNTVCADDDTVGVFKNGFSVSNCEIFINCDRCKKTFRITSTSY